MTDPTAGPPGGQEGGGHAQRSSVAGILIRHRLLAGLDAALTRRLTLVVAGAGYGKTALLRTWRPHAPLVWQTIGRREQGLPGLVRALTDALGPHLSTLPADLVAAGRAQGPDADAAARAEALAAMLCDALARDLGGDLLVVLDDVGVLEDAADRFVEALCHQAPARLHLVLTSRTDVPYGLARMRAQGEVLELTGASLAFTAEESAAVVGDIVRDDDGSLASELHTATGGWPAAVRLAAEAVRSLPPPARAATITGLYRPGSTLFAYLAEEVLAQEPADTHELLRTVGVLPRFSEELCAAVGLDVADAVASLTRRGVFVVADPLHPGWLCLTDLARQFVRERLPLAAERRQAVLGSAAAWCERAGVLDEALHLRLAAGEQAETIGLLRRHGSALLESGLVEDVIEAVDALAPVHRDTMIEQLAGEAHQIRGDWDEALVHFRRAAAVGASLPTGLAWRMGLIHYLRGELDEALEIFARDDASGGPADRALVAAWAASAHWLRGSREPCAALADQALAAAREADDPRALAAAQTVLAMLAALRSDRAANDAYYAHALANAERAGDVLQIIRIRSNRASLHMEEGAYDEALRDAEAALALSGVAGYAAYHALALTNRGETYLRLGRLEDAYADLDAAKVLFQRLESRMIAYPLGQLGDVYAERGDTSLARAAYEEAIEHAEAAGDAQGLVSSLAGLAAVVVATDPAEARRVAERAVAQGEQMGLVRALLALGTVAAAMGDRAGAQAAGEKAAAAARHRRDRPGLAAALVLLGGVSQDRARARGLLEEAAAISRSLGSPLGVARAELGLARCLAPSEEDAALRLIERVAATARAHGARGLASDAGALAASLERRGRASLAIRTLGGFRVLRSGTAVTPSQWPSRDARELLKVLVARRGRPATMAALAEALWPDAPLRDRIAEVVEALRATLDPAGDVPKDRFVVTDGDMAWLEVGAVDLDVESFLADANQGLAGLPAADAVARLQQAEAAYTGEFLEENRHEDWAAAPREEVRTVYIAVARALADLDVAAGAHDRAARYLQRLLEQDPYDEAAHLALVSCLAAAGRPAEARRRYGAYRARIDELGLEPAPFPAHNATQGTATAAREPRREPEVGVLRREGDVWLVSFGGERARLRHSRGLEHLAVLLARPGQDVHAVDLAAGRGRSSDGTRQAAAEAGLHRDESGLPVLDAQAKTAYRRRLRDLQDDLDEAERFADDERAARAREEIDMLAGELAAAVGLGGRDRTVGSTAERARQATSKAIKVAVGRIAEQLPALGEHLTTTVHTGTYCSYRPDPRAPLRWQL